MRYTDKPYDTYFKEFSKNWKTFRNIENLNVNFLVEVIKIQIRAFKLRYTFIFPRVSERNAYDFSKFLELDGFFEKWDKKKEFIEKIVESLHYFNFTDTSKLRQYFEWVDWFKIQDYFYDQYSKHFKKELTDKKILIKLLEVGIFVDKEIYDHFEYDKSFQKEVREIDPILTKLIKYYRGDLESSFFKILKELRLLKDPRFKYLTLPKVLKNSFIFNLLAVRSNPRIFNFILQKFKNNRQIIIARYSKSV